jgi:hypothetical protein
LGLNCSKIFSLEAPFISGGDVRGIKACKKMPFFNAKSIRCLRVLLLYPTDILSVQMPMWITFELREMKKKAGVNTLG